ncbi:hypothetical protein GCM10029978_098070 [Actinoallomurus acanthiterrae]
MWYGDQISLCAKAPEPGTPPEKPKRVNARSLRTQQCARPTSPRSPAFLNPHAGSTNKEP